MKHLYDVCKEVPDDPNVVVEGVTLVEVVKVSPEAEVQDVKW